MNWFNLSCDLLQQGFYFIIWTKGGRVLPLGNSGTHCLSFPAQTRNWLLIAFVGGCRIHGSRLPASLGIFPSNHTSHLNFFSPTFLSSLVSFHISAAPFHFSLLFPSISTPFFCYITPPALSLEPLLSSNPSTPVRYTAITKDCKSKSILPTFVIPSASES